MKLSYKIFSLIATSIVLGACNSDSGSIPNDAPIANFDYECQGLSCSFTSTSRDPDGTISSYSWDFGDGTEFASNQDPKHTFDDYGEYYISLSVKDDGGASSYLTIPIIVLIDVDNNPHTVDFDNPSIILKQDYDHRQNGKYTVDQFNEDMCFESVLYYGCLPSAGFGANISNVEIIDGAIKADYNSSFEGYGGIYWDGILKEDYDELYMTFRVKYSGWGSGLSWRTKANGLMASSDKTKYMPPTGGNPKGEEGGFSSRHELGSKGVSQYVYHQDQPDKYGEAFYVLNKNTKNRFEVKREVWYTIEMRVKMNTPGENNGEVETWINGVPMLLTGGFTFSKFGSYGINWVTIDYGVSSAFYSEDGSVYHDLIIVSTERVVTRD